MLRLKLDESSGTVAADSSGSGNNGTVNGGLTWQPSGGKLTGAALFNGVDSHIAVPDNSSLDATSAFTLSWWFKANSFNGSGLVAKRISFDNNNSYGAFLTVDGKLNVDINSNNDRFTSTTTFNLGAWYHVALVFDGSLAEAQRVRLYVNGTLDKTTTETSTSIPNYTSTLHLGTLLPGSPVFDGLIDEVRFHRRALTASEVAAIKNETGTFAPTVSTGPAPAAIANSPATLNGSVSAGAGPTPSAAWTKVSGPGNVVFANAASPATTVTFDQPGIHVLRLSGSNANGETSRTLAVTVLSNLESWRQTYFGTTLNTGIAADSFDANGDGELNLLEFATAQNPNAATLTAPTLVRNGSSLELTYTKNNAATDVTYLVEWSRTLGSDWSTAGVIQTPVSGTDQDPTRQIRASVALSPGNSACFLRLRVTRL